MQEIRKHINFNNYASNYNLLTIDGNLTKLFRFTAEVEIKDLT